MTSKNVILHDFKLYAVTDADQAGADLAGRIDQAYAGGADIVQLRAKKMTDHELFSLAQKVRLCASKHGKLFFMNDRLDIALAVQADGLHLGQEDLPLSSARDLSRKANHPLLLGKSTHSVAQALQAQAEGADYIGVGPVFSTPTKPGREPVGLALIREVAHAVQIPFVAIGGIDMTNVQQVLDAGARRIACVRALFDQENVAKAASELRKQIEVNSHDVFSH